MIGRTADEQRSVDQVLTVHSGVCQAVGCFEACAQLLRDRPVEDVRQHLDHWMTTAEATEVPELTAFVTKLRQDADAVATVLELPYSPGQTERQINRVKLLKCAMYGRAGFDLLWQCVLYAVTG